MTVVDGHYRASKQFEYSFDKLVMVTILSSGRVVPTRFKFNRCNNYCYFSGQQVTKLEDNATFWSFCFIRLPMDGRQFGDHSLRPLFRLWN